VRYAIEVSRGAQSIQLARSPANKHRDSLILCSPSSAVLDLAGLRNRESVGFPGRDSRFLIHGVNKADGSLSSQIRRYRSAVIHRIPRLRGIPWPADAGAHPEVRSGAHGGVVARRVELIIGRSAG